MEKIIDKIILPFLGLLILITAVLAVATLPGCALTEGDIYNNASNDDHSTTVPPDQTEPDTVAGDVVVASHTATAKIACAGCHSSHDPSGHNATYNSDTVDCVTCHTPFLAWKSGEIPTAFYDGSLNNRRE